LWLVKELEPSAKAHPSFMVWWWLLVHCGLQHEANFASKLLINFQKFNLHYKMRKNLPIRSTFTKGQSELIPMTILVGDVWGYITTEFSSVPIHMLSTQISIIWFFLALALSFLRIFCFGSLFFKSNHTHLLTTMPLPTN